MKRLGIILRLKSGITDSYREYHEAVWPEVLDMIRQCNIRNYSTYSKDDILFTYFEYHGSGMNSEWAKMAAHKKPQEWWAIMQTMQDPVRPEENANGGRRWMKGFTWIDLMTHKITCRIRTGVSHGA